MDRLLAEMTSALVGTRTDVRESLVALRRLESKLDSVADAVLGQDEPHDQRGYHGLPDPAPSIAPVHRFSRAGGDPVARSDICEELEEVPVASGPVVDRSMRNTPSHGSPHRMADSSIRLKGIENQLGRIMEAMGVKELVSAGDDNEDRRRLKEKLNQALENDRRNRLREIVSEREVWLEYLFGICKPDRRNGKRGNRCDCYQFSWHPL